MSDNYKGDGFPPHYDPIDNSICTNCYLATSQYRPPVFNPDNCCCAEAASHVAGRDIQSSPYNQTYHTQLYNPSAARNYNIAVSNASTNLTVPSPEGPERDEPNLVTLQDGDTPKNHFLQIAPEKQYSYNSSQHQKSTAFDNNLPVTLQRYLSSREPFEDNLPQSFFIELEYSHHQRQQTTMQFIPQTVHVQQFRSSSARANQSSRMSRPSAVAARQTTRSGQSSWSSEAARFTREGRTEMATMTGGMGAWVDEDGDYYCYGNEDGDYDWTLEFSGDSE